MKIVLTDIVDIPEPDRTALKELGEVEIYDDVCTDEAVILDRIQGAEMITAGWSRMRRSLIQTTSMLRLHQLRILLFAIVPSII